MNAHSVDNSFELLVDTKAASNQPLHPHHVSHARRGEAFLLRGSGRTTSTGHGA